MSQSHILFSNAVDVAVNKWRKTMDIVQSQHFSTHTDANQTNIGVTYYLLLSSSCITRVFLTTTELKTGVFTRSIAGFDSRACWSNTKHSLGQLTSTDLVSANGKTKVNWLISIHSLIRQCFNILIWLCNPSRIRNIKIKRSKQLYHNNTLPLFSPLPKLGQWCDVSWPRECHW